MTIQYKLWGKREPCKAFERREQNGKLTKHAFHAAQEPWENASYIKTKVEQRSRGKHARMEKSEQCRVSTLRTLTDGRK